MARFYIFFSLTNLYSPHEFVDIQKLIKIKGSRETWPLGVDTEALPRGQDLTIFENLPEGGGDGNAWN